MKGLRGSFLGFTYNDIHSSVLGITRTENGQSSKKLIPDIKDIYIEKPLADGQYWYGQVYSKREFTINFTFEEVTEEQLARMKMAWGDKKIHDLIFDEEPYKIYSAKITGSTMLKHLPFDVETDGKTARVYRGEGSLTFTCYFPFARSRYPYIEDYTVGSIIEWNSDEDEARNGDLERGGTTNYAKIDGYVIENVDSTNATITSATDGAILSLFDSSPYINILEWKEASRLPSRELYPQWLAEKQSLYLYNAGDIETPFKIYFSIEDCQLAIQNYGSFVFGLYEDKAGVQEYIKFNTLIAKNINQVPDVYIEIDMKEGLICGCNSAFQRTGTLYNEMAEASSRFFLLPKGRVKLESNIEPAKIDIFYLYL